MTWSSTYKSKHGIYESRKRGEYFPSIFSKLVFD